MPKRPEFVHLHVHSEYSLLDGASRLSDLIQAAKAHGMTALAITDHGNMSASVDFYTKAQAEGIKPLMGCEIYLAPRTRFDKSSKEDRSPYHGTVIAKNAEGYRNLLKLVSLAHLEGFYYRPRIDRELLEKYGKGLIVLSGCPASQVGELLTAGKYDEAKKVAGEYRELFGDDYYLEIQNNNLDIQRNILEQSVKLSRETGIPLVATNDSHYTHREDARAQDIMICIQTGKFLEDTDRLKFETDEFYLKSPQEMAAAFKDHPDAVARTLEIAEKCDFQMDLGKIHLPEFPLPQGETAKSYLRTLCQLGIVKRYGAVPGAEIGARLEKELAIIEKMGYEPYFLIVCDFIQWAKNSGIEVGPGRGSAAGSIVAYALGITEVDPIRYDLIFERFLNPDRISMPDIDVDFCFQRRDEVIQYVTEKYGKDHVAQIITFGTMAARAAIRDVGRVLRIPLPDVDKVAKMVPPDPKMTIEKAISMSSDFRKAYESDQTMHALIDTAKTLEGMVRHASIHAAGIVISRDALIEYLPVQVMNDTQVVTQVPMEAVEKIGLLKMDFLGLRNLTMIGHALKLIEQTRGVTIDWDAIDLNDKKTYQMLTEGETMGVFQLESRGMRGIIRDLKPDKFEYLIALLALYRPGPLESGMVDDFIKRRHGKVAVQYDLPELEPILKETYGTILYQEQVMRIASDIAGFTLAQADGLRRIMGKKKASEMAKQQEEFVKGAVAKGFRKDKAEALFNLCSKFAGYGFNKSHSTAYALISFRTAYLKAHFPIEFMAALLTSVMGVTDKVSLYIAECQKMGVKILPPSVDESGVDFTVVPEGIRFGLAAVKNVGMGAVESILAARKTGGPYTSLQDFCQRVDGRLVNKRVIDSLIKCGAFDSLGAKRAYLIKILESTMEKTGRSAEVRHRGQGNLFGTGETVNGSGAKPVETYDDAGVDEFHPQELLKMEKDALGFYISDHPLSHLRGLLESKISITASELSEQSDGKRVVIGGLLTRLRKITTRRKELMMTGFVEDLTGAIPLVVFPKIFQKVVSYLQPDAAVIVRGRVDTRNDELKVVCDEIEWLGEGAAPKTVHIELGGLSEPELLARVRDVLGQHKGGEPVYLHMNGSVIEVGRDLWVTVNPILMNQVDALVGEGSIWTEAANGKMARPVKV